MVNGDAFYIMRIRWREQVEAIPAECVTDRPTQKSKNYLLIPSTERAGVANELGRNCFAVYALLTTGQTMDPTGKWRKLPVRQSIALGLDRYKIYRAMACIESPFSHRSHIMAFWVSE